MDGDGEAKDSVPSSPRPCTASAPARGAINIARQACTGLTKGQRISRMCFACEPRLDAARALKRKHHTALHSLHTPHLTPAPTLPTLELAWAWEGRGLGVSGDSRQLEACELLAGFLLLPGTAEGNPEEEAR